MKNKETQSDQHQRIYAMVIVEGISVKDVATQHNLTVPQIEAIVDQQNQLALAHANCLPEESSNSPIIHLRRLEHQWREAMAAWYRSQNEEETTKVSRSSGARSAGEKMEQTRKTTSGDVRYLQLAQRLLNEIRELHDQIKADHQSQLGAETDISTLTLEQRPEELHQLLDQFGQS
ncbi:MAG: hypothetical protein ACKVH8_11275 [Pirellulales bacterium]